MRGIAINHFTGNKGFTGKVYFSYPKPSYGELYYDHYGGDISFNHSSTCIYIANSLLSIPSPVVDPLMHQQSVAICEQQLNEVLSGGGQAFIQSTETAVSTLMFENPGKIWSLGEVADTLHMSPRSLIRKLDAEGTTFQFVRDDVAKKQGAHYLSDARLTAESVAHLMGFSDVSSFRRSFKRWFGETPSQHIARIR
jgi:AraC-like DNA-binding protein